MSIIESLLALGRLRRWRLHAQEPGDMVYKYWQSSLLEKIATSNF